MRKISAWASCHVWAARFLIAVFYVLLNGISIFIGRALLDVEVDIPAYYLYALAVPFFFAWCTYPRQKKKHDYFSRKWREGVLVVTTFLLVVCMANQRTLQFSGFQPVWASLAPAGETTPAAIKLPETKKLHSVKKKMRQQLRENMRQLRQHYRQASDGGKTALIILSVLVAITLLYGVAALSCGIACSGSEGLALFVAVLGTGLIVFLLVRVIKSINRKGSAAQMAATSST